MGSTPALIAARCVNPRPVRAFVQASLDPIEACVVLSTRTCERVRPAEVLLAGYDRAMTRPPVQDEACFRWPVRIYWEDTDGAGIVYYANYLKYLERARTEWLRSLGCSQQQLARRDGVAFVVRAIDARFLRPARLDDELVVAVSRLRAGASLVEMKQTIVRADELLHAADVKLACVRIDSFLPVRLPRSIRELLADRSSGRPTIE